MNTPDRSVALVLAGAVSLGSWEAGVLAELLYGLEALAHRGGPRHRIDIITGASAGSMTAALVARALMVDYECRRMLHEAWVDGIDIRALTEGVPPAALLSSTPIDEIAERCLMQPPFEPVNVPVIAPASLFLSFTVSNMNGVDFQLHTTLRNATSFTSTFHAERRRFVLDTASIRDASTWDALRHAALCSGSFPFAFLPRRMASDAAAVRGMAGEPAAEYCYVDGGLFNNEPLKEAVQLAAIADGGVADPRRKFLLVDASLNRSTADAAFTPEASLGRTLLRVAGAIMAERGANDWLRALRTNTELEWRDRFSAQLADIVRRNSLADPHLLRVQLDQAITAVVDEKRRVNPGRWSEPTATEDALHASRAHHAAVLQDLDPARAELLNRMLFLLDNLAGLQRKTKLDLDIIHAEPGETAGDQLFNFGGFFNRDWREHDYRLGRRRARELMPAVFGYDPADVPPEQDAGGRDLYAANGDYSRVTMQDADLEQRRILRDAIASRIAGLAREQAPGPRFLTRPFAGWLVRRIVKRKLDAALEL